MLTQRVVFGQRNIARHRLFPLADRTIRGGAHASRQRARARNAAGLIPDYAKAKHWQIQ